MDQELFARFRKCAVEVLSVEESAVVPEASFGDDLDADSLDLVELVLEGGGERQVLAGERVRVLAVSENDYHAWTAASAGAGAATAPPRPMLLGRMMVSSRPGPTAMNFTRVLVKSAMYCT